MVLLSLRLRAASVVDVDTAADESPESAVGVEEWRPAIENPSIHAVVTPKPILHLEAFACLKAIEIEVDTALCVIRVDAFGPAFADLLLQHTSREREPRLVEVITTS